MHDLNDALDELRHVIPYAHSPSVRKLSKIATLLLAKNYILMQTNALNELRRILICLQQHFGSTLPQTLSASITTLIGNSTALIAPPTAQQPTPTSSAQPGNNSWPPASNGALDNSSGSLVKTQDGKTVDCRAGKQQRKYNSSSCVDEQQATSVQNRRRKYNMLINRILGDVASQHLLNNPFQQPPQPIQLPQHLASDGSHLLRPIDFCTQNKPANNMPNPNINCPPKSTDFADNEASKRKFDKSAVHKLKKRRRLVRSSGDQQSDDFDQAGRLSPTSNTSERSGSSCSSLVSVGSPQYKD